MVSSMYQSIVQDRLQYKNQYHHGKQFSDGELWHFDGETIRAFNCLGFKGERKSFSIKLDFHGTDFQKKVWEALLSIPYGKTRSYLQIAAQLNNTGAVRAVGAANGKNPISIIAPCHRVVGASGSLTGFAGGLENKAILLKLENSKADFTHGSKNIQLDIFDQ